LTPSFHPARPLLKIFNLVYPSDVKPFGIRQIMAVSLLPVIFGLCACQSGKNALVAREIPPAPTLPLSALVVQPAWPTPSPPAPGKQQLFITTFPEDAQVFLDERFYGQTPLLLPDFPFGHYFVKLFKNGYEPLSFWMDYSDSHWAFFNTLVLQTGELDLRITPPAAVIRSASQTLHPGPNDLPPGKYTLTASAFGYRTKSVEALVTAGRIVAVDLALDKVEFGFSSLGFNRASFNPRRAGPASGVTLHFTVNGPGSGSLAVTDQAGREVARLGELVFSSPDQVVQWNGRTASGDLSDDGLYTFVLRGAGGANERPVEARLAVTLDSNLFLEHGGLWSGSAGLWYTPSPAVLAPGGFELAAGAFALFTPAVSQSAQALIGARLGLGWGQEAAVSLGASFSGSLAPGLTPAVSWKYQVVSTAGDFGLSLALQAKAAWQINYHADLFTNPSGLSLSVPFRLALGPVAVYLTPEFTIALYKLSANPAFVPTIGAYFWFYGRAGILVNADIFTIGASVSIRTVPLDEGWALASPVQSAIELNVYIPDSPLYLTASVLAEWGVTSVNGWGGFGFGLMF
jgi:hypothetical protein